MGIKQAHLPHRKLWDHSEKYVLQMQEEASCFQDILLHPSFALFHSQKKAEISF